MINLLQPQIGGFDVEKQPLDLLALGGKSDVRDVNSSVSSTPAISAQVDQMQSGYKYAPKYPTIKPLSSTPSAIDSKHSFLPKIGGIAGVNMPAAQGVPGTDMSTRSPEVMQSAQKEQRATAPSGKKLGDLGDLTNKEADFISAMKAKGYQPQEVIAFVKSKRSQGQDLGDEIIDPGTSIRRTPAQIGEDESILMKSLNRGNIIGKGAEGLDEVAQMIPNFDVSAGRDEKLDEEVANLSPEERSKYEERFNSSEFNKKLYGDVDTYIREKQKSFRDIAFGDFKTLPNMVVNTPGSLAKLATATARGITNPYDTLRGLATLVTTPAGKDYIMQRYGSLEAFQNSMEQDPVGVASDILTVIGGGAKIAGFSAKAAGSTSTAGKLSKFGSTALGAGDLGLDTGITRGFNALEGATEGNRALSTVTKGARAMTEPVTTVTRLIPKDIAPTADGVIQRMNRLSKGEQANFAKQQNQSVGEWLNDRGIVDTPENTVMKTSDIFTNTRGQIDAGLDAIEGNYKHPDLELMLDDSIRYAENTRNPELSKLKRFKEIYGSNDGLEMKAINEVKRFFERNNKFNYGKDLTAGEKTAWATNVDNNLRKRQMQVAKENGFDNLAELNKEVQASKFIMDKLTRNENGRLGNNAVSITDWIVAAPAMVDPSFLAGLVTKKVLQSNRFTKNYAKVLNRINGHKTIAEKTADLVEISKVQNEKQLQDRFNQQTKALPNKGSAEAPIVMPEGGYKTESRPQPSAYIPEPGSAIGLEPVGVEKTIEGSFGFGEGGPLRPQLFEDSNPLGWELPGSNQRIKIPVKGKWVDKKTSPKGNPPAGGETAQKVASQTEISKIDGMKTDLIEEAKKYKSAEEFIDAQPKLYRGQSAGDNSLQMNEAGQKSNMLGEAYHFTTDKKLAEQYGKVQQIPYSEGSVLNPKDIEKITSDAQKKLDDLVNKGVYEGYEYEKYEALSIGKYPDVAKYSNKPFIKTGRYNDTEILYFPEYDNTINNLKKIWEEANK